MVYKAKGDSQKAADCYRKVIEVIRAHPDNYDPDFEAIFHSLVAKLDPSAPTPAHFALLITFDDGPPYLPIANRDQYDWDAPSICVRGVI